MKSMKLSTYFALRNPRYTTLQLIPSTSNRNYDTELIATTIASMTQLPLFKRFKKEKTVKGFKVTYNLPDKCCFIIQIEKSDCKFFLIVSELYKTLYIGKAMEVWKRVTVKELDTFPQFKGGLKYSLSYSKEDALSLKLNKKTNEPLTNILSAKSILIDGEEIDIFANFIPINQFRWKGVYNGTMQKLKIGLPVEKNKFNALVIGQYAITICFAIIDFAFSLIDSVISSGRENEVKSKNQYTHDRMKQLSPFTIKKEGSKVLQTQILINSSSTDPEREKNNIKTIIESYKVISQDNSLEAKKIINNSVIDPLKYTWNNVPKNTMTTAECNNLIQLPGRELIEILKMKTKVDVLENPVPEELQNGNIPLGLVTFKDKKQNSFLPSDYNIGNLMLGLLGPQGCGKSNFIANFNKYANKVKEGNIIIDFVKNCELSDAVKKAVDSKDVIDIDLSQQSGFQAFAFNEVQYSGKDEFQRLEVASMKTEQTLAVVDAINNDGLPLTGNMRRILNAAANIVYLHNNSSIGDVIKCLDSHVERHKYLDYAEQNLTDEGKSFLLDATEALKELDKVEVDTDKKTKEELRREVVGTKRHEIEGILDRINLLKENMYCKYMFSMKADRNINFVKAMEDGKTVLIRMPEHKFSNTMVKNVLVTFFTSKIMLATKLRGSLHEKPSRCNVFFDEVYQAPTAMGVLVKNLSQLRKFGTKVILSMHHLEQLSRELQAEMKGSGASYMLFSMCGKEAFQSLKDEFNPYELEDLLNLKSFHSLNLIRTRQGYQKFISQLPKALF
jgi:ABC-type cobalamin/Fe3+-siderophores transport system ATPase subunit